MGSKTQLITGGGTRNMFILLYRPPKSKSNMISHPFADNPKFRIVDYTSITLRESNVTMENHPYYNHLQTFFSSP